jgi:hypothetical protein
MNKFICLALLLICVLSTHQHLDEELSEESSHDIGKNINWGCCQHFGGVVCGTTFPECCSGGCRPGLLGGSTCIGHKVKISASRCPNSCRNMCSSYGGIICGTSVTTEECCQPQFCSGLAIRTCAAGSRINTPNCVPGTSFSKWRW